MENKEMAIAADYTNNFTKPVVNLKYNGWSISVPKLIDILRTNGYTVSINCMTYRHHGGAWAIKR